MTFRKMAAIALTLFAMACGSPVDEEQVSSILELEGDPAAGAVFYAANCERCHGPDGNGDGQGPELRGADYDRRTIVEATLRGPFSMPSFADEEDQSVADVTAFVEML